MLAHHADETQRETHRPRWCWGVDRHHEPHRAREAGSDVGALRTKAVPAGDGTWRITGTKIFISFGASTTCGEHHPPGPARTPTHLRHQGISCFIVPKYLVNDDGSLGERNDRHLHLDRAQDGHQGQPHARPCRTATRGEGAIGHLIGGENRGMRYMFTMMNNARLSVGVEGLAPRRAPPRTPVAYAQERRQVAIGAPPARARSSSSTRRAGCCSP